MKWQQIPLGALQTNCYIVENSDRTCLIFDPGGEGKKLINLLNQRGVKPIAIFLTHAHFDHIGAVDEVGAIIRFLFIFINKKKNG